MEIKRKPQKFYLDTVSTKREVVQDCCLDTPLYILANCDERGDFPGSEDPDDDLYNYGPSRVTKVHHGAKKPRDEFGERCAFVTLTFEEYITLGKPKIIYETRKFRVSR